MAPSMIWRSRKPSQLRLTFVSLLAVSSATNLQLTSVQPIVGFSTPCTTAYSQLLPSCSFDDLVASVGGKNGGCSTSCMADLTSAQSDVQGACQGERASRQTVIGQMFLGSVVGFVCGTNVGGAQSISQAITSSSSSMAAPTTTMSTATPVETPSSSTSTEESSTSITSSTSTVSSSTVESEQTSTSTPAPSSPTQNANNGNRANGEDGTTTTFDGAGGGSPFDGGPGDFDGAAGGRLLASDSCLHLIATFTAMLLLLR